MPRFKPARRALADPAWTPRAAHGRVARGFTVVEAMLAVVILGLITAAISGELTAGRAESEQAQKSIVAGMLANALMQEIVRLPYTSPASPPPGTPHGDFTTIGQYNGYTDGPNDLTDMRGQAYPANMQKFTRAVAEQSDSESITPPGSMNQPVTIDGTLVTVTVAAPSIGTVAVQRFVPNIPPQP